MNNKRVMINKFFESREFAIAGVSRNEHKTGSVFLKELKAKGLKVVGINPNMSEIDGEICFKSVSELPKSVDAIITTVKPENTLSVVKSALEKGITNIWMQLGSQSDEAIKFATENGMNVIYKECLMMYCEPVTSIHKFHRGIMKLFGKYHKN
ncbi:MAG: CoA-binding protein [Spirochaetales bacterium]|nr:CoA-binding protein [Spirochaetales bacterium]